MKTLTASCGLSFNCPDDIASKIAVATASGFDFVASPILHPRYRLPEQTSKPSLMEGSEAHSKKPIVRKYPFTRSDLLLHSSDWTTLIVGLISKDMNLESEDQELRRTAELRLKRELEFSNHLGLAAIMVTMTKPNNANLSRILYSFVSKGGNGQIWIRVPINNAGRSPPVLNGTLNGTTEAGLPDVDTWEWWDVFRGCANSEKRLFLALSLDKEETDKDRLKRWLGEPVKCLIISTSLFLANKKGWPVLPRSVQTTVRSFIPLKVQFVIEGRNHGRNVQDYQRYMNHLVQQYQEETADPVRQFAQGYEDFLQSPLQPLMDNLESSTYEVFEKDPVKYNEYQRAIRDALLDRVSDEEASNKTIFVMVLGAGRGPLVRAALKAAYTSGRKIKVYAIEKNPNAIVTLLSQKEEDWGDKVEVVSTDMREWRPESGGEDVKADIVISELLGSFGDNELSPECLYAAEKLFKSDTVSIPSSYTSWIGPLQSSKLHHEVRSSIDTEKGPYAQFETPYVVHFQNSTELAKPQPLFTFEHPSRGPTDVNRYGIKQFEVDFDCELHGFGGYFECVLYKSVVISINPKTHSKGMFSWFPIFFPLRSPIKMKRKDNVELHFWRLNNGKNVWYEWCITKPVPVPIHNPNGRSYQIGL